MRLSRVLIWQHWSQGNAGGARGPSRAHLRTPQVLVHGKPETRTEKVNKTRKVTFSGWFEFCQGQEPVASRPSWWDAAPARLLPPPVTLAASGCPWPPGKRTGCGSLAPCQLSVTLASRSSEGVRPPSSQLADTLVLQHTHEGGERATKKTLLLRASRGRDILVCGAGLTSRRSRLPLCICLSQSSRGR